MTDARLATLCTAVKARLADASGVDCQAVPPAGSPAAASGKRRRRRTLLAGAVDVTFDLFGFMTSNDATTATTAIQSGTGPIGTAMGAGITATFTASEAEVESLDAAYVPAKVALTEAQLKAHLNDASVATVLLRRHIQLTGPLNVGSRDGTSVALVGSCDVDAAVECDDSSDDKCTITGAGPPRP